MFQSLGLTLIFPLIVTILWSFGAVVDHTAMMLMIDYTWFGVLCLAVASCGLDLAAGLVLLILLLIELLFDVLIGLSTSDDIEATAESSLAEQVSDLQGLVTEEQDVLPPYEQPPPYSPYGTVGSASYAPPADTVGGSCGGESMV
ncbi:hypothetical protein BDV19DRAFT_392350 [Aspergillus venezuelensis]